MSIVIFLVVSLRIAPKLMMEAYIFKFGKQTYPTSYIVSLYGWSAYTTLIFPLTIPEVLSTLKLGSKDTFTFEVAFG